MATISIAESTHLLGQVTDPAPLPTTIFLEVTESPWSCITRKNLVYTRYTISILMSVIYLRHLCVEILQGNGKIFFFLVVNLTSLGQIVYMWLTAHWTFLCYVKATSLIQPRLPYKTNSLHEKFIYYFLTPLFILLSYPAGADDVGQNTFAIFYTSITTFPFISSFLFWFLLRPHPFIPSITFSEFSVHIFNSLVALAEILLLNSVSRLEYTYILVHILTMITGAILYCEVWVWIGNGIVNPRSNELDWRFFGKTCDGGREVTFVAVSVVIIVWITQWAVHMGKGNFIGRVEPEDFIANTDH
ncbi:hypothetical protein RUND412_001281 [Rhizina undulata]